MIYSTKGWGGGVVDLSQLLLALNTVYADDLTISKTYSKYYIPELSQLPSNSMVYASQWNFLTITE